MRYIAIPLAASAAFLVPKAAQASEIFGGLYAHDVKTGVTRSGFEDGVDLQLGWRGERIRALGFIGAPSPHAYVNLNSAGESHFAAAGVSWKIGGRVYVRPGVGVAIHTGPSRVARNVERIDFGSRILFEPEIGIGVQVNERMSIEASWVHLSHAKLFGPQNPGIDNIGVRLNLKL